MDDVGRSVADALEAHGVPYDAIEMDYDRFVDRLGRPLGPTTRRVFEENGVRMWVRERKDEVSEDLEALGEGFEPSETVPEIGDRIVA